MTDRQFDWPPGPYTAEPLDEEWFRTLRTELA
jgi:hypothetical protein